MNTKSWNDIPRVKNSFLNRVICVCHCFNCKLKGKLFTPEVKRKPQTLILNWIKQRNIDPKEAVVYVIYPRRYEAELSNTQGNIIYTASQGCMWRVLQGAAFH